MQIVITLNSTEEFLKFMGTMNYNPVPVANQPDPLPDQMKASEPDPEPAVELQPEPTAKPQPEPETASTVSRQDVQAKAIALMDAGKQKQLQDLLTRYNVTALPYIPEDQLAAFMADLEVL